MFIILRRTLLLFFILSALASSAQHFAEEMHFSADGKRLITGNLPYKGFYKSSDIHTINIQFSGSSYWSQLANNFPSRTDKMATVTVDGVVYDSVGVRFKGNSSYSAIGTSEKKSFNISFDDYVHGQNVGGYNTIVLNNCFEDRSFVREVFYERLISKHIPSPKGNFAHLYINGQDWGLYDNVEQLNHEHIKEWFTSHSGALWRCRKPPGSTAPGGGNGDSLCSMYDFGTDTTFYSDYYNLKSSGIPDPFTRLMTTIRVLDTITANNAESILGNYIDIDRTLWYLASENAFADDDSYIFKGRKDYYLYFEPETGRMVPLEMDGNDAMDPALSGLDIFFNHNYTNFPLMKLLNFPRLHQRYLAHMRTIVRDEMDTVECFQMLDDYYSMIDPIVNADPKKLYTYTEFVNELPKLKSFIRNRRSYILGNSEINVSGPSISSVNYYSHGVAWERPAENEDVWVKANITCNNGIDSVYLYTSTNHIGKFSKVSMRDDGLHHDNSAGDGIYGAMIPGKPGATWVRFYVEAVANNSAKTVSYDPAGAEHDVYTYLVKPAQVSGTSIVINELMAKNTSTVTDSAGEYDDWIELYNNSNQSKDISGYFITDTIYNLVKWKVPSGTVIPPHGYQIFWADENKEDGIYNTNFHLSASIGETLLLMSADTEIVDQVTFGHQVADRGFARVPNGTGSFVIQPPTFEASNDGILSSIIFCADTVLCPGQQVEFTNNSLNATTYTWDFGDGSPSVNVFEPTHTYFTPGSYTVSLTAGNGLSTDVTYLTINVFSTMVSFNFTADTLSTLNSSYLLDAGAGYTFYHWSTNELTQTISVGTTGTYCVTVGANQTCRDSDCVYVIINGLGINEPEVKLTSLYPNPANEFLNIKTGSSDKTQIEIHNSLGQLIYYDELFNSILINTESWNDGIYFARIGRETKIIAVNH